jgi:hypothetical protein
MDAAVQCTICVRDSELEASSRLQRARQREQAEQLGFWWHSRRQVAQRLGVPDSSLRHCLQRHHQRCQASCFPRDVVDFCVRETVRGTIVVVVKARRVRR